MEMCIRDSLHVVPETGVQDGFEAARQLPVGDGHHELHPLVQIAGCLLYTSFRFPRQGKPFPAFAAQAPPFLLTQLRQGLPRIQQPDQKIMPQSPPFSAARRTVSVSVFRRSLDVISLYTSCKVISL